MDSKIMVEFSIYGNLDNVDVISEVLNIAPSEIMKKESSRLIEYAYDFWTLSTGYQKTHTIIEPFEYLVGKLSDKVDVIKNLIGQYDLKCLFMVVIKAKNGSLPEIILSHLCIDFAARVNAEIHFDPYIFEQEDDFL